MKQIGQYCHPLESWSGVGGQVQSWSVLCLPLVTHEWWTLNNQLSLKAQWTIAGPAGVTLSSGLSPVAACGGPRSSLLNHRALGAGRDMGVG